MKIKSLLVLFLAISISDFVNAQDQTFKLKDGTIIVGSIKQETESDIEVQTKFGIVTINKSELILTEYIIKLQSGETLVGIKIEEDIDENNISRLPYLYYLRSDVHWVWTDKFKIFLMNIVKNTTINKIGPILWYLPKNEMLFDNKNFNILLFDTTPYIKNMTDSLTGEVMNYNIVENMCSFLNDTIKICETIQSISKIKISIYIKRKRNYSTKEFPKNRNVEYLYFMDELLKNKKELVYKLEPETNIYSAIYSSDLSISFPFLAPAYVSSELKREAIFYDPTSNLKSIYE